MTGCAPRSADWRCEVRPPSCAQDTEETKQRLTVAWQKAFDGERPTDVDLQAYQDAIELLECLER